MLTLEEIVEKTLIEEGQFLMGEEYLTDVLGLSWDKMFVIFQTCAKMYARRKPVREDKTIHGGANGIFLMPEGTLSVRTIRYDILTNYPKTVYNDFGQDNYEYDIHTRVLRTFPPMTSLRIVYDREYSMSTDKPYKLTEYMASYENEYVGKLPVNPKKESIIITKDNLTMAETGIEKRAVLLDDGRTVPVKFVKLSGDLGKGYYNPETREMEIKFKKGVGSDLIISCTPKFPYIEELNIGEYVFVNLFKANLLEAVASVRSQIVQDDLQNIDFSGDDLYARVRILKRQVESQLGKTIDWGNFAPI